MLNRSNRLFISCRLLHLPPDALLEPDPALLPAVGLEAPVYPVLHHGDELLIAEETIAVIVEYLEDSVHHVRTQVLPSADVNSPGELVLKI